MADYCQQCSLAIFGEDYNELAGLSRWYHTYILRRYPVVLCEGCGPTQVDHRGRCISTDCLENHNALGRQ